MSDYTVRMVHRDEIDYMISMGSRLHKESAFRDMDYDYETIVPIVRSAVAGAPNLFFHCIVHVPTEVPVGMLLAVVMKSYFGKDYVANDMLLYVDREHRGLVGAELRELIDDYNMWARQRGAKRVYLSSSTTIDPDRTEKLFEACGFHKIGTLHEA